MGLICNGQPRAADLRQLVPFNLHTLHRVNFSIAASGIAASGAPISRRFELCPNNISTHLIGVLT